MRLSSAFVSIPAVLAFCGVAIAAPLEPRAADQCTTAGTMICNADLTQFALCNPPAAPIWQAVAPGTACTPTGGSPAAPGVAPPNGAPVPPVVPVIPPAVKPSSNVGGEVPLESPLDNPPLVPTVNPGAIPSATGIKQAASPTPSGGIAAGGDATSTTDVPAAVSAIPLTAKDTMLADTFGGVGSKPIYGSKAKGKKRSIAYYQLSDGVTKGAAGDNYESFKGLTHLILFSVNMNVTLPKLDLALERTWPSDVISKVRAQDTAVMAAFGGWAMDELYKGLDSSMEAIELGVRIADFAIDNGLDGIDIDHEYVVERQVPFWPDLINAIRARCDQRSVPDMMISIALPAVPANMYDKSKAPVVEQVLEAYTAPLFARIDKAVTFYNMMTYDMLNRYDQGKATKHQASLPGTIATIDYYDKQGIDKEKMNSGTPVYPKWFPAQTCDKPKGLGCMLDASVTELNSGANRFRADYNWWDRKKESTFFDASLISMGKYINGKDGNVGAPNKDYYDEEAKADSFYDKESKIFWTWQGPQAIAETCKGVIESGIGGQMIFAAGMDTIDLPHWNAWMDCVRDWK